MKQKLILSHYHNVLTLSLKRSKAKIICICEYEKCYYVFIAEYRTMLILAHYSVLAKATERMKKDFLRKKLLAKNKEIYI